MPLMLARAAVRVCGYNLYPKPGKYNILHAKLLLQLQMIKVSYNRFLGAVMTWA